MKSPLFSIFLFICWMTLASSGYGQYGEESIVEIEEYSDEYDYTKYPLDGRKQIEYQNSTVEKTEFDRDQWEIIKRSIVDGLTEDKYKLVEEGEGGYVLTDEDNPYKKTRKSYKKYFQKKHAEKVKTLPQKEKTKTPPSKKNNSEPWEISSFWSNFIMVVVILLFALLVFYLFFNAPIAKKSKKIADDLEGIKPTEIPKTQLELALEKALLKKDYRKAIRIYFIFIIRGLIDKEWIEWEKEKTNLTYLYEMRDKPFSKEFESAVSAFEIVWYGKREITEEEFKILEPRFKSLTKNLGQ